MNTFKQYGGHTSMQYIERLLGDWKSLFMYPVSLFGLEFVHIEMIAKLILWILAITAGVLNVILLVRKLRKNK